QGAEDNWIEIVKDLLYAFIVPLVYELVKWGLGAVEESKKRSERERIREEKLESYRDDGTGLMAGLQDLCRRKNALVLVVDNAYALKAADQGLLKKFEDRNFLRSTDSSGGIRRFEAAIRVLVVTLDFPQSDQASSSLIR